MTDEGVIAVSFVKLGIPEPGPSVSFYESLWGLQRIAQQGGTIYLRAAGPEHHVLALATQPEACILELGFSAADKSSVDAIALQVKTAGAQIVGGPAVLERPGGGYGFAFEGPERIRCSIASGVFQHQDLGNADKPARISHVVLNVTERESCAQFFIEALGFRLSDYTKGMHFLRCNSDHHSLALADGERLSLNHVAYELPSIDSLMHGAGRLMRAGVVLEWGIGRHGPGNNVFAYFIDPAGFVAEYTAELEQVLNEDRPVGRPEEWEAFWRQLGVRGDRWSVAPPMSDRVGQAMAGNAHFAGARRW